MSNLEVRISKLLEPADIRLVDPRDPNARPWDVRIHNPNVYSKVLGYGSVGAGESYMSGDWDADDLPELFFRAIRFGVFDKIKYAGMLGYALQARLSNMQSGRRAFQVGESHYDLGNDFYKAWLDPWMMYTCGYTGHGAKTLDQAQEDKLQLSCEKLQLRPGQKLLEIGCGWGGFLKYAAERYGVSCVGITISREQADYAREWCKGLPVEIRVQDYRETTGSFDKIVSMGMLEHVGFKNYPTYMCKARSLIKDDGLFLLHCIGSRNTVWTGDAWFHKYIFRNGMLPSVAQLGKAMNNLFIMEDWHNFGADYPMTLRGWRENFVRVWPQLEAEYGHRAGGMFYRMWIYYLASMEGAFRARQNQLWQMVFSPRGVVGGYRPVR